MSLLLTGSMMALVLRILKMSLGKLDQGRKIQTIIFERALLGLI
ncbi:hypothetical protein O23A_p2188 [Aeromonas salmonicida]|nr:hypothetical protein O23A_p2188 [Aeromonas salmonicida]